MNLKVIRRKEKDHPGKSENNLSFHCESSKKLKSKRLFLKFLLLTPPFFFFRIKTTGPFQNLDVDLILQEAYGHAPGQGRAACRGRHTGGVITRGYFCSWQGGCGHRWIGPAKGGYCSHFGISGGN